jgi:hypothetical protein
MHETLSHIYYNTSDEDSAGTNYFIRDFSHSDDSENEPDCLEGVDTSDYSHAYHYFSEEDAFNEDTEIKTNNYNFDPKNYNDYTNFNNCNATYEDSNFSRSDDNHGVNINNIDNEHNYSYDFGEGEDCYIGYVDYFNNNDNNDESYNNHDKKDENKINDLENYDNYNENNFSDANIKFLVSHSSANTDAYNSPKSEREDNGYDLAPCVDIESSYNHIASLNIGYNDALNAACKMLDVLNINDNCNIDRNYDRYSNDDGLVALAEAVEEQLNKSRFHKGNSCYNCGGTTHWAIDCDDNL